MNFAVLFAPQARADLFRLFQYLIDRAETAEDLDLAERAVAAVDSAAQLHLSRTPFIYRKAVDGSGLRRELIVPFGTSGYVLLYEIADATTVVILAVRHQLEQDYH